MRAAFVQQSTAGAIALTARSVSRVYSACRLPPRSNVLCLSTPVHRLSLQHCIRHATTATTPATASAAPHSTQANASGSDAPSEAEAGELQRLQALIKEKLARQKQQLLEQLSPLSGEQTSGSTQRTRAQREAERAEAVAPTLRTAADSAAQPQPAGSDANEQPRQRLSTPLPLRKPAHLHSASSAPPRTPPSDPRRASEARLDQPPRTPRPSRASRSSAHSDEQPLKAADEAEAEERFRSSRRNDPNLNEERQAMLHERNVRRDEQKRLKQQRRLEREEAERDSRQDDELFHDVVSPRQKVRGKGIAGAAVLAKHQRHTKGVREDSARDEDDEQRGLSATGSVEERMSRSVFPPSSRSDSGGAERDVSVERRDQHRRQLKYAERGERGSRQDWAGAGKPGRWEAREQQWQAGRRNGQPRRVGEEYVGAQRERGHGVAPHPWGHSAKRDTRAPADETYTYSRERPRQAGRRDNSGTSQSKDQFAWLSDVRQRASSVQREREDRETRRDRGRGPSRRRD